MEGSNGAGPPVLPNPDEYNFTHPTRGTAIIINNKKFAASTRQSQRKGAEHDSTNLETTFELLGFNVKSFMDLTVQEMLSVLAKESQEDHSQSDCFVCAISSHGDEDFVKKNRFSSKTEIVDVVYGIDGLLYLEKITSLFKDAVSPTLASKPKMFFIQACRGADLAETVEVADGDEDVMEDKLDWGGHSIITKEIPIYKDFLLAYSAPPGFFSFRRGIGSWFITSLCNVLQTDHKRVDLLTMLTRVSHQMVSDYESNTPKDKLTHQRRIVPWIASNLTRDVYFHPKTAENERIEFV